MDQPSDLSRRRFLKSAAVMGATATGFSHFFGYERVFAQSGDSIDTILNLAATAETLACTHYYNVLTDSQIALTPAEVRILKSTLDAELQHLEFLNANKAQSLANEFYFPRNVYTDRDQFSDITEQAETVFVAAYLAAVRRLSELGEALLAATVTQIGVIEQLHLALVRQIGGRLPNHVSLGQPLHFNTSEAQPILQGFLEGGQDFAGPRAFPGADAIRQVVGQDGVMSVKPFTDPTLFK